MNPEKYAKVVGTLRALVRRALATPTVAVAWMLCVVLSLRAVILYARVVSGRVGYPYDLEWMEGGLVDHAVRLLEGKPLYVEPSLDFAPFIYNPLFYVLGAASSTVVGTGPFALRLVSVAASLATGALLAHLVFRSTRSGWAGVVAAGVYYSTFELSGGYMDLARVDSTFIALTLAALHRAGSPRRFAIFETAALVCVAFLAKQYAVVIAAPIALYFALSRGLRAAALFSVLTVAFVGASILALNALSGGWYWFWAFRVPAAHGMIGSEVSAAFREHVSGPVPLFFAASVVGGGLLLERLVQAARERRRHEAAEPVLLLGSASVLLVQAWYSYDHPGSYLNCLMPAHLTLALLSGIALGAATKFVPLARLPLLVSLAIQLWLLGYAPRTWVPSSEDRKAGAAVEQRLRKAKGKLGLLFRGYYGGVGVNPPHAHEMALFDLFATRLGDFEKRLRRDARERFANGRVSRLLLDQSDSVFMPEVERYFEKTSDEPVDAHPGRTRSGVPMRPRIAYERKRK